MNDSDRNNVFKLVEFQNQEVIFMCFPRQLSFVENSNSEGREEV